MSKTQYKYILEDSHTFIRLTENGQKEKIKTGEIIMMDDTLVNKGRMYLAWFREVLENGETEVYGNEVALAENAEIAKKAEKEAKVQAKKEAKESEKELEGNAVPEIIVPMVDTTAIDDSKDEITIKVA